VTKANDLFEKHLEYLRKEANEKGIHLADILDMVADAPPENVALAEILLTESPDKRAAMLIKRYRIQFYAWLADEGARIAEKWIEDRNLRTANLKKGSAAAGEKRTKKAAIKNAPLITEIQNVLGKHPLWTAQRIADFLLKDSNPYGNTPKTILAKVKAEKAKYRKASS